MSDGVFADANVLVYARDTDHPQKQQLANEWMAHLWRSGRGRTSVQVLNEYYWIVTRKLRAPMSRQDARQDIIDLDAWRPLVLDDGIIRRAWQVEERYQLAYWDALVVAASQLAGCRYLLTEDLEHGQVLGSVEVVDPFVAAPGSLL
jgi:predicted nucleic acid-binding protein